MFTNEFEPSQTITTVIDEEGSFEDIKLVITDDLVYLEQWNDEFEPDLIVLSHSQWYEILQALKTPEGAYLMR
jgi:hypothetical protein